MKKLPFKYLQQMTLVIVALKFLKRRNEEKYQPYIRAVERILAIK
jgi:hypothetical protein